MQQLESEVHYTRIKVPAHKIRPGDRFTVSDFTGPHDSYRGGAIYEVVSIRKETGGYFAVGTRYIAKTRLVRSYGGARVFWDADSESTFYVRTTPGSKTLQLHEVDRRQGSTVKETATIIRSLGLTVARDGREWRVRIPGAPEADYFTDDNEDAIATAKHMSREMQAAA